MPVRQGAGLQIWHPRERIKEAPPYTLSRHRRPAAVCAPLAAAFAASRVVPRWPCQAREWFGRWIAFTWVLIPHIQGKPLPLFLPKC